MIQRFGVGKFIFLALAGASVLIIGLGSFTYFKVNQNTLEISTSNQDFAKVALLKQRLLSDWAELHSQYSPLVNESDIDAIEKRQAAIAVIKQDLESLLTSCGEVCSSHQTLFRDYLEAFTKAADQFLKSGDRTTAIHAANTSIDPLWGKALGEFRADRERFSKLSEDTNANISKLGSEQKNYLLALMILSSLIVIAAAVWLKATLVSHLRQLSDTLFRSVEKLEEESTSVSTSSSELANAVTAQSSAIQETMAAIEEMKATMDRSADQATKSEERAIQSGQSTSEGKTSVSEMARALEELKRSAEGLERESNENNEELQKIVRVIDEIGAKTKVINEIVFQTKLLSFNASVEAARAGEAGKGFSVVAQEVGNLAKMSGSAAQEISDLLRSSIELVNSTVNRSRDRMTSHLKQNHGELERGSEIVDQSSTVFEKISTGTNELSSMIHDVALAMREMNTGFGQISQAINQLENLANQNSGTANSAARSAQIIDSQASELGEAVAQLRQLIEGKKHEAPGERFKPGLRAA